MKHSLVDDVIMRSSVKITSSYYNFLNAAAHDTPYILGTCFKYVLHGQFIHFLEISDFFLDKSVACLGS